MNLKDAKLNRTQSQRRRLFELAKKYVPEAEWEELKRNIGSLGAAELAQNLKLMEEGNIP